MVKTTAYLTADVSIYIIQSSLTSKEVLRVGEVVEVIGVVHGGLDLAVGRPGIEVLV